MNPANGVRNVSVLEIGRARLHTEHMHGTRKPALWWIFLSRRFEDVPLNAFVIEHDDGLVLFDTGPSQSLVTDQKYWSNPITRRFMRSIFRFQIGPEDTLAHRLVEARYRPSDVTTVVLSHLHFDHAGGIADVPGAKLLVAPSAWRHRLDPHADREAVLRRDLDVRGAQWHLIDFAAVDDPDLEDFGEAFDVAGDGSMMVVRTPGHLPGSVSMLVRRSDGPPVLLIGDLAYSSEMIAADQVAATGDADQLRRSYAKVRALQRRLPDLVVVASHDDSAGRKLASGSQPAVRQDRSSTRSAVDSDV